MAKAPHNGEQPAAAAGPGGAAVREFYERYPYPRPVEDLDSYRLRWQDPLRRRAEYHLAWPDQPFAEARTILVAGCGTSQAAKHALRWPAARVVGIDVSATSIAHTQALQRKYGLQQLEVHELPIERVADLGLRFDEIVCTGVLHHLSDPASALHSLRDVLDPQGVMQLMVYAPYGRTGIYMLQDFCRRVGIEATDAGIRTLVDALGLLPSGHPLSRLLREAPDFRQEAGLADALLNPQDRAYSVPQFMDWVGDAGLSFGRWMRQAPYSAGCGILRQLPQGAGLAALPVSEQSAAAELFRGTMLTHSAIVRRDDVTGRPYEVDFGGDVWLDAVPIRVPDTLCIQEKLPPGAVGVLINRAHAERDIYLPIDAAEKRLFDAIDGRRSVRDIAAAAPPGLARSLFQQLWWHDQVVFAG